MTQAVDPRSPPLSDALFNALPHPVILIAPDGRIVEANSAAEAFFEMSLQFLRRQTLSDLVPFGSPLLALVEQVARDGAPVNEYRVDLG
ncbi:MAG: PAS domain-containing protein, partial [Xanthobacteraceae bacterium]